MAAGVQVHAWSVVLPWPFTRAAEPASAVAATPGEELIDAVVPYAPESEQAFDAVWIGPAGEAGVGPNRWFAARRAFTMTRRPELATARIACDSKYWLSVNGELVVREGQLKRGPNPADTFVDTVDLTPYLHAGSNSVALLVWHFGKEGFSHKNSGRAGLLFQLDADGWRFCSDATWRVLPHPAYGTPSGTGPNFRLPESNVRYDAALEIDGWTQCGFDDSSWPFASAFGAAGVKPWGRLWPRPVAQWKNYGVKDYEQVDVAEPKDGSRVYTARLPYCAQVNPCLEIDAPAGKEIEIRSDTYDTTGDVTLRMVYATRAGEQTYEFPVWLSGHAIRYTVPEGVTVKALRFRETGLQADLTGSFSCDDPQLDRLWTKAARTLYVTMRDTYMDCPDRERAQWWGDAVNELGEVFYALSPEAALLTRKAIYDLCGWQRPDKTLFSPCPAGNWDKELPCQMLASISSYGFLTYYRYTGDKQTMVDAYPAVRDYLSIWQTDADGLIVHRGGGWDWADWGEQIDARLADNVWFCLALDGAAEMAELAGKPVEARAFRAWRKDLAAAINARWWTGAAYRSTGYAGATDDRFNALAVVAGIVGPDKYQAIRQVLATEEHASPYMEKYVLEALYLMDDPDAAVARMKKRFGRMADHPTLTTLWEGWGLGSEGYGGGTANHAWSGGALTLLSQYAAGIAPLEPGFRTFTVRPRLGPLRQVRATVDSFAGPISVDIRREAEQLRMVLTVPPATEARVLLPLADCGRSIAVNGTTVWRRNRGTVIQNIVRGVGEKDGLVTMDLPAGEWSVVTDGR